MSHSPSSYVKWGLIAVVIIVALMFMFPWLLNLGVANMGAAWGEQLTAFFNSLNQTVADTTAPFVNPIVDAVEVNPYLGMNGIQLIQEYVNNSVTNFSDWLNSWWPF